MNCPARFEWQTRCEFNAYCKRTLRNEPVSYTHLDQSHVDEMLAFAEQANREYEAELYGQQAAPTPDDRETGETVRTPRGTFHVTDMSREQMEAVGYGFHHESEDGKRCV